MTDRKYPAYRPPLYHLNESSAKSRNGRHAEVSREAERTAEQKGWEAYRKWLSRVSTRPTRERSPIDHSLYSWKGYNNWAENVRASWKPDDGDS